MINQNSQFFAILTNVGLAKQANADALGVPWKIAQMGIGDANDTDPVPSAAQTKLINEWRRAPLNSLKVDPTNSAIIIAEQVIPADVGGQWIREIALYDSDGDMVAVANCAPSFKPLLAQGSGRTQVVRLNMQVNNSGNVDLKIDPSVVLATRAYVDQKIVEELNKQDFKFSVVAATTGPVVLNGLQTLDAVPGAEGLRVLVWKQALPKENGIYLMSANAWTRAADADTSLEVTPGLFVHVERGTAYGDSVFQLVTDAPIVLGTTDLVFESPIGRTGVTAGTYRSVTVDKYGRVVGATNPTTLAAYGIADAYTKAQVDAIIAQASALPVGATVAFPAGTPPPGFLELDGSVQSSATYPDLSAFLAGKFNTGNEGVGNFRLPESRGEFLRGWDNGRGVDAGRSLGSYQKGTAVAFDDATAIFINALRSNNTADDKLSTFEADAATLADYPKAIVGAASASNVSVTSMVGASRPRNLSVMWCIKAWNAPINQGSIDIAALAAQVQKLALNGPPVGSVRNGKLALSAASASATYTADEVIVSTALGAAVYKLSGFNKAINLTTVGAGGMDVGAAPVAGFVALYAIYNPDANVWALLGRNTTSILAESIYSGGKMPVGYTASALLTVLPTDASGLIKAVTVEDRKVSMPLALSYSLSTTVANNTPVVLGSVPLNARSVKGEISMSNTAASGMSFGLSGWGGAGQQVASFSVPANGGIVSNYGDVPLSVAQTVYVSVTNQTGSPSYALYVGGYTI